MTDPSAPERPETPEHPERPATPVREAAADEHPHYALVGDALAYIAEHWGEQPRLADLAARAGMSEAHFQRVFARWAGVSPKQFLGLVTLEHAREVLAADGSVLDATYDTGLSGPGRLHDLFVGYEAMTPGAYKAMAEGLTIRWGWHEGPFGETLAMQTERGLCGLAFRAERGRAAAFEDMAARWPRARFVEDPAAVAPAVTALFGEGPAPAGERPASLRVLLKGTRFQVKVWEALMRLPPGALTTYGRLAERLGMAPGAARAVGAAVGANPMAWLIPCHRVIRGTGLLGGYHWGLPRKVAMIGAEQAGRGLAVRPAPADEAA